MEAAEKMKTEEKKETTKSKSKEKAKVEEAPKFHSLRFRSTGLGKTMMQGEPDGFDVVDDMLVMYVQTTTPTRWRIRSALTYKAVIKVIVSAIRWKVIKFLLFGWIRAKNPRLSDDF
jgi:hypothetical protein